MKRRPASVVTLVDIRAALDQQPDNLVPLLVDRSGERAVAGARELVPVASVDVRAGVQQHRRNLRPSGEMKRRPALLRVPLREGSVFRKQAADGVRVTVCGRISKLLDAHAIRFSKKRLSGSSLYSPNGGTRRKPDPS